MQYIFPPTEAVTECVTITPDANGEVTQTLQQNRLYYIASTPALTILTLTASAEMLYCGLDFVTGSTAPTLSYTTGWTWTGADCSRGIFTPSPNKTYRMAFESSVASVYATVQEVR